MSRLCDRLLRMRYEILYISRAIRGEESASPICFLTITVGKGIPCWSVFRIPRIRSLKFCNR